MTAVVPYNLLIADDDASARETLRDIFEPRGYHTILAQSGEEAIDIVSGIDVHLVLMDMHMPRLSGLETMEIVRQIKGMLPTILLSADRNDDLIRRALDAQFFCVLAKPVDKNVVIHVVNRALSRFYQDA